MIMSFLSINNAVKTFGSNTVVKGFDLEVEKGEFVSFLGPSGCGKTTVLRLIAGFERPSSGTIIIDGRDVTDLAPNMRRIGMVFQAYALFPNMNVFGNIAFGLTVAGLGKPEIEARVKEMLGLIGLSHLADRYPYQMSGGQQQRVALARALAPKPQVLLLDEPLSALDAKIRVSLRKEIREIQRALGITTVFVTHDQEEALSISDRVVVMNGGMAEQIDTPLGIYNNPKTRFVASFVGALNVIEATVKDEASGRVSFGGTDFSLSRPLAAGLSGGTVALGIRPEAIELGAALNGAVQIEGRVEQMQFMGGVIRFGLDVQGNRLSLDIFNRQNAVLPAAGQQVSVRFDADHLLLLG
jgi:putative spermidine/putrescine transport system ATP-binding protein